MIVFLLFICGGVESADDSSGSEEESLISLSAIRLCEGTVEKKKTYRYAETRMLMSIEDIQRKTKWPCKKHTAAQGAAHGGQSRHETDAVRGAIQGMCVEEPKVNKVRPSVYARCSRYARYKVFPDVEDQGYETSCDHDASGGEVSLAMQRRNQMLCYGFFSDHYPDRPAAYAEALRFAAEQDARLACASKLMLRKKNDGKVFPTR